MYSTSLTHRRTSEQNGIAELMSKCSMLDNPVELWTVVPLSVISMKYRKKGHFEVDPNVFENLSS